MKKPKYKKGQVVYGRSDWFGGAYIPEQYTIREVTIEDEQVLYKVKGRNVFFEEDFFFPTEEEAQVSEVERFCIIKKRELEKLKELLEKHNLLHNGQLAIEDLRQTPHKFTIGQIVYGHMDGKGNNYEPERFEIVGKSRMTIKGETCTIYKMKGHGARPAYEEFLYSTYKEALMAEIDNLKKTTKGEVNSIKSRSHSLGIEQDVKLKLLTFGEQNRQILLINDN